MLVLRPESVELSGEVLTGVDSIVIERTAGREIQEFGDRGSYAWFVDVPERKVSVRIVRGVDAGSAGGGLMDDAPHGGEVELVFVVSRGHTDRARSRVSVRGVVTRVAYESKQSGVKQTLTLAGLGRSSGAADPVLVTEL